MSIVFESLENWGYQFKKPLIIAGPCSAESHEQVITTAKALAKKNVNIFRSGIWKPRSRPDAFQGIGKEGLSWLKEVKETTGLPVAIEVANAAHVELALENEIDFLWIGARSSVSPFNVQEIADALDGVDIPIFIKNPVNPDIELWTGAIERIHQKGIKRIAAIHRGFSSFEKTKYRNNPNWEIPIELKRRFPDLPLLCDPSHIAGKKELLLDIAQNALDLNYSGLMIEVHHEPEKALSDKEQQITPTELDELLLKLSLRKSTSNDPIFTNTLEKLRGKIDDLDYELLSNIAKRMELVQDIGIYKRENQVAIYQPERWNEIVNTRTKKAVENLISKEFIIKIFESIHEESIRKQSEVMKKATEISAE